MLVPFILHVDRLTVITNSLQTASELTANDNIKVFALGGEVDAVSLSTSGSWTTSQLEDVRADVAFLGWLAYTEAGLSSGLFEQVHTKRSLIARANSPLSWPIIRRLDRPVCSWSHLSLPFRVSSRVWKRRRTKRRRLRAVGLKS